jgi:hypothetical protein
MDFKRIKLGIYLEFEGPGKQKKSLSCLKHYGTVTSRNPG